MSSARALISVNSATMVNNVRGSGKEPNAELFVALVVSLDPQVKSLGKNAIRGAREQFLVESLSAPGC